MGLTWLLQKESNLLDTKKSHFPKKFTKMNIQKNHFCITARMQGRAWVSSKFLTFLLPKDRENINPKRLETL